MVFRLDIGLKFARSDSGKPGFFSRGEISVSLNLDGKAACVKERFAKCEVRMEKVSVHDFRSDVGICLTLTEVVEILRLGRRG